jgi:hypothetical protein
VSVGRPTIGSEDPSGLIASASGHARGTSACGNTAGSSAVEELASTERVIDCEDVG